MYRVAIGTYGAGISLVGGEQEFVRLRQIESSCKTCIKALPGKNALNHHNAVHNVLVCPCNSVYML